MITFGNYKDSVPQDLEITMNGCALKRVESIKYLGLIYGCNIKWDTHVNNIIKKTKYLVFVFYKLKFVKQHNPINVKIDLLKAPFRSLLQ